MRALPLLAAVLCLCACAGMKERLRRLEGSPTPAPQAYVDPALHERAQRVLVLPLSDESGQGDASEVVSAAVRDEMLRLRRFELVQPNPSDARLKPERGPKQSGRIDVATLIELGRRYGVDAVLFGAIDHYRAYEPPAVGMSLSLIEVSTGRILWHVRDYLDGADRSTALAMKYFFEDETARNDVLFDRDIMGTSPRWFARFAARRVARTLEPGPPPREDSPQGA